MSKTPILTREEFHKIYEQGEEATYAFFQSLMLRIEALEQRLGMNSTNSSKPPSSDGYTKPKPKPKSLREKTGKKTGGQQGHPGTTLTPKEVPDIVVAHEPQKYTEHQVIEKECPCCHLFVQKRFRSQITERSKIYAW